MKLGFRNHNQEKERTDRYTRPDRLPKQRHNKPRRPDHAWDRPSFHRYFRRREFWQTQTLCSTPCRAFLKPNCAAIPAPTKAVCFFPPRRGSATATRFVLAHNRELKN